MITLPKAPLVLISDGRIADLRLLSLQALLHTLQCLLHVLQLLLHILLRLLHILQLSLQIASMNFNPPLELAMTSQQLYNHAMHLHVSPLPWQSCMRSKTAIWPEQECNPSLWGYDLLVMNYFLPEALQITLLGAWGLGFVRRSPRIFCRIFAAAHLMVTTASLKD